MKNKVLFLFVTVIMVTSLVIAGCGAPESEAPAPSPAPTTTPSPTPTPEPEPEPKYITLGISSSLSGWAAEWGMAHFRGGELLFEKTNAAGGLDIGGEKHLIKWIVYDDKFDPTEGAIIANRLIHEDKVDVFITMSGEIATVAREISRDAGKFQFGADWVDDQPSPDYPLAFANLISFAEIVGGGYPWLAENYPEIKTIAKISPNYALAVSGEGWVKRWAELLGIEVLATERPEPDVVDFTPVLNTIVAKNPDMIDVTAFTGDVAALIVKQSRELGYTGMFVGWDMYNLELMIEIAGAENTEGFISGMGYGRPYLPAMKEVEAAYVEKYGPPWVSSVLGEVVGWEALLGAIEKAGTWESEALANAMRGGEFTTITGTARFGGKEIYGIDNQILSPLYIAQIQGGEVIHLDSVPTGDYPT